MLTPVFSSPFNLTSQFNVSDTSNGVAWADLNNDECLDAVITEDDNGLLYLQNSSGSGSCLGTFTNSFTFSLPNSPRINRSVVLGDFNNDGRVDVAINTSNHLRVWRNTGASFTQIAAFNPGNSEGMAWADYDADGDLDLVVENHQFGTRIYVNNGSTISSSSFFNIHTGNANGDYMAATDYDVDGDIDFYFRRNGTANNNAQADLFRNNGGSFSRRPSPNEQANNSDKGGAVFCDLDNDGDFDLVRTDSGPNAAYRQNGGNYSSAATFANNSDGVACADVDNDGDMDVFFTSQAGGNDRLYLNNGNFSFSLSNQGITASGDGEGTAFADYDRDGDMDLLINQQNSANQLYENQQNDLDYLQVRATQSNRDSTGATVRLLNCSGSAVSGVREINGGMGHGSQGAPFAHFGLANSGGNTETYIVRVQFIGGTVVQRAVQPSAISGYQLATIDRNDSDDTTLCNADLFITKDDGTLSYAPGGTGTYTIIVSNAGPRNVVGASIVDNLPNGMTLSSSWNCAASSGSSCSSASGGSVGGSVVSLTADLLNGGSVTVTVPVQFSADMNDY